MNSREPLKMKTVHTIADVAQRTKVKAESIQRRLRRAGKSYGVHDVLPDDVYDMVIVWYEQDDKKSVVTTWKQPDQAPANRKPDAQPKPTQKDTPDLGQLLTGNNTVIFLFAITLLSVQAWIFASLQQHVFADVTDAHQIPFGGVFLAGMLFESSGLLIASRTRADRTVWIGGDKVSVRSLWVTAFFVIQIVTDFSFFGLFGSWSDLIGRIIISLSVPFGIAAYSNLYFKS